MPRFSGGQRVEGLCEVFALDRGMREMVIESGQSPASPVSPELVPLQPASASGATAGAGRDGGSASRELPFEAGDAPSGAGCCNCAGCSQIRCRGEARRSSLRASCDQGDVEAVAPTSAVYFRLDRVEVEDAPDREHGPVFKRGTDDRSKSAGLSDGEVHRVEALADAPWTGAPGRRRLRVRWSRAPGVRACRDSRESRRCPRQR